MITATEARTNLVKLKEENYHKHKNDIKDILEDINKKVIKASSSFEDNTDYFIEYKGQDCKIITELIVDELEKLGYKVVYSQNKSLSDSYLLTIRW